MKNGLAGVLLCLLVALSGCTQSLSEPQVTDSLETLHIGNQTLRVAVMRTSEELAQGLSGRASVPGDGMLFLLPERQVAQFWMKDMQFAIDMIWIDGEQIVGIVENVPPPQPGQSLDALPTIRSPQPVTVVLELPAGDFRQLELATGAGVFQRTVRF